MPLRKRSNNPIPNKDETSRQICPGLIARDHCFPCLECLSIAQVSNSDKDVLLELKES